MSDLASRLLSAIQERKRAANVASGPWYAEHELSRFPVEDRVFIAANSPAAVLRQVERDERALERHSPDPEGTCWHGDWAEIWPCIEVRELAASYAIPTEDPK